MELILGNSKSIHIWWDNWHFSMGLETRSDPMMVVQSTLNDTMILILLAVMVLSGNAVLMDFSSGHCWELNRFKSSKVKWHKSNLGFRSLSIPRHSFISWWLFIIDCRLESVNS